MGEILKDNLVVIQHSILNHVTAIVTAVENCQGNPVSELLIEYVKGHAEAIKSHL